MASSVARIKVLVVGAGVIGLSCAVTFLEHNLKRKDDVGFSVTVVSSLLSPHITSDCAGAVWGPFSCGGGISEQSQLQVYRWALETYDQYFDDVLKSAPTAIATGVQLLPMVHLFAGPEAEQCRARGYQLWAPEATPSKVVITQMESSSLPASVELGYRATNTPFVDPSRYLQYLLGRFL